MLADLSFLLVIPAQGEALFNSEAGQPMSADLPMTRSPAVYILASDRNGTLYTGVTSDLIARVWQHQHHLVEGFTKQYSVTMLVWYEMHSTMDTAITREKQLKKWNRAWKLRLIQETNPQWQDLWTEIVGETPGMGSRLRGNDEQKSNP